MFLGAACGPPCGKVVDAPATAAPPRAPAATPREPAPPPARWVLAPSRVDAPRFLAPYRTPPPVFVVDLGGGRRGVVDRGRRFVLDAAGVPTEVTPALPEPIGWMYPIAAGLGGGFLFPTGRRTLSAPAFDAPVKALPQHVYPSEAGPRCFFVQGEVLALPDLARVPDGPKSIHATAVHPSGFAVVEDAAGQTHFTRDGRTWIRLPFTSPSVMAPLPDDAIAVIARGRGSRVRADGTVVVNDPTLDRLPLEAPRPAPPASEPFDDARLVGEEGWVSSRGPDPLFVRFTGDALVVARRGGEARALPVDRSARGCTLLFVTAKEALLECGASVGSVDLATGETFANERSFALPQRSTPIPLPTAPGGLVLATDCDGDIEHFRGCARKRRGIFVSVPLPPAFSAGGVRQLALEPGGRFGAALEQELRVFDFERAAEATFERPAALDWMRSLDGRAMELPGRRGVRVFVPRGAMLEQKHALALDATFDGVALVHTLHEPVVGSGRWALRLKDGALWESGDGWDTWRRVDPPPTGVPADFDNARCNEHGCNLGAWLRVGWGF